MKKITLLLVLLLAVVGVNAKTETTTLWTGASSADAELHLENSKFTNAESGDVLRITFSFTTAGSMHLCWKTGEGGDWSAKAFDGIGEYPYFSDTSVSSAEYSINATDLTTLQSYGMYIYGFTSSTITKIELIHTCQPTSTGDNLLSGDWESSKETAKILSPVSDARIGDVLQFTVSTTAAWNWVQFKLTDKDGNVDQFTGAGSEPQGNNGNTSFTFEFIISNLHDLKMIKNDGFGFIQTGNIAFTMTAVNLLTYADSYGYTTITIPDVGYATWSSDKKYDFKSAGLQAYYASGVNVETESVTLTPMDITWDYQGYIIKGSEGEEYDVLESLTTDGSYYPNENLLVGAVSGAKVFKSAFTNYEFNDGDFWYSDADDKADKENIIKTKFRYIFAKKNNEYGFYKLATDYERPVNETTVYYHELGAHKAYLETADDIAPTLARVALIFDDGETTGVKEVKGLKAETRGEYYDLMGRKVAQPTRGLYIVNGKKVVIK